jgi:hypothetical protein
MKETLRYTAAKLAMGKVNADEVKSTINDLVDSGVYLDAFLVALEPARHPQMDDVLPALLAAFNHFGILVPDKQRAVWELIDLHCRAIVSGSVRPLEELSRLITDVYCDYFHVLTKQYLGDSHGIERLIGLYWGADDLTDHPDTVTVNGKHGKEAWAELDKEIVIQANHWLKAHQVL